MALGNEEMNQNDKHSCARSVYMQKFKLYETRSNFYMIGSDKTRSFWKVLKIDRVELTELNICEDSISYSEVECYDLLRRINEGNKPTGGLNFVTICYGIVGFIKFLGPYYMMIITKRKKVGAICGHTVYSIAKTEIIPIPNSTELSKSAYSKNENRYKKLLCNVDLTKDFFFSYSYHVMCSLQKNCGVEKGQKMYETMFVWNEFLTRGIRNLLKNTAWTVALVFGFFKQAKLSVSGRDIILSLIARRSRHFAGTRYLKRGVNEKGRVANDVETEQIVFEDVPQGQLLKVTSVVQNRGSIPLFWSQETSRLNIKPDIILSKRDQNFEATRRHFENLANRYGHPIIVLNLIKSCEKKPRESILRAEFANAIAVINKDLYEENRLKFLHWDLHKQSRNKAINVLSLLGKVSEYALNLTGIFHCQITPISRPEEGILNELSIMGDSNLEVDFNLDVQTEKEVFDISFNNPTLQKGVLRTNCIDCLDRTNVAQYAFGFAALGHQLHELGLTDSSVIDTDDTLASELMEIYEKMGDTLALQYGGSAAHNKIFSERRGQWKATAQSQEFFRTIQRYYSNVYMDAEKQDAINVFLGHFQPHEGKPALWELDSDQHYNIGRHGPSLGDDRCLFKRSLSDGDILCKTSTNDDNQIEGDKPVLEKCKGINKGLCDSTPEISVYGSDISLSRYVRSIPRKNLLSDMHRDEYLASACSQICFTDSGDTFNCSNFLDVDWVSSSGNSYEDDAFDRSTYGDSPGVGISSENIVNEPATGTGGRVEEDDPPARVAQCPSKAPQYYSDTFCEWVASGGLLYR